MKSMLSLAALAALLPHLPAQTAAHAQAADAQAADGREAPARNIVASARPMLPRATPAFGQGLPMAELPQVVVPIHTQTDDPVGGAYGTWAAGSNYKASFHDGATFVPYLDESFPENLPLSWRTTSVRVGNTELMDEAKGAGRRVHGTRYEYDFGKVVEAYDVQVEGLEQTFVIAERPATTGDLTVTGTVRTPLTAGDVKNVHGAVQFVDASGQPILLYGAATAVDAAGARRAMTTTYRDGTFELRLDASWLRDAQFPVVVDPLMQNNVTLSTATGSSAGYFDVLRDDDRPTTNVWICYSRVASGSDRDLWVMRTEDNLPSTLIAVAFTDLTTSWTNYSCALGHADERVVCAFVRDFGTVRNVRWHSHHVDDTAVRTGVGFPSGIGSQNWRVDVGGNRAFSAEDRALIVYQHEPTAQGGTFANTATSEVAGFFVDFASATTTTATGSSASPFTINGSSAEDCERPNVNQVSAGIGGGEWMTVHQVYNNTISGDDWDVSCRAYDNQGARAFAPRRLEDSNGRHKLGPVVEGFQGRYLVSYASASLAQVNFKTTAKTGYDLNTFRVNYSGTIGISLPYPEVTYLSGSTRTYETGDMSFNTNTLCHWLVVNRADDIVFADLCGYRGQSTNFDNLYQTGVHGGSFVYPGKACFNDDNNTHVVITGAFATGSHPIVGNIWSSPAVGPVTSFGTTCSSATLSLVPQAFRTLSQRIGHEFNTVRLDGVPSGSFSILAFSPTTANSSLNGIPGVGIGCQLLINSSDPGFGDLGARTAVIFPTVSWNIPLPENLNPGTIHFQAFHTDATGSVFLTTRRLSVPLGH